MRVYVSSGTYRGQKRLPAPLELELQAVVTTTLKISPLIMNELIAPEDLGPQDPIIP